MLHASLIKYKLCKLIKIAKKIHISDLFKENFDNILMDILILIPPLHLTKKILIFRIISILIYSLSMQSFIIKKITL